MATWPGGHHWGDYQVKLFNKDRTELIDLPNIKNLRGDVTLFGQYSAKLTFSININDAAASNFTEQEPHYIQVLRDGTSIWEGFTSKIKRSYKETNQGLAEYIDVTCMPLSHIMARRHGQPVTGATLVSSGRTADDGFKWIAERTHGATAPNSPTSATNRTMTGFTIEADSSEGAGNKTIDATGKNIYDLFMRMGAHYEVDWWVAFDASYNMELRTSYPRRGLDRTEGNGARTEVIFNDTADTIKSVKYGWDSGIMASLAQNRNMTMDVVDAALVAVWGVMETVIDTDDSEELEAELAERDLPDFYQQDFHERINCQWDESDSVTGPHFGIGDTITYVNKRLGYGPTNAIICKITFEIDEDGIEHLRLTFGNPIPDMLDRQKKRRRAQAADLTTFLGYWLRDTTNKILYPAYSVSGTPDHVATTWGGDIRTYSDNKTTLTFQVDGATGWASVGTAAAPAVTLDVAGVIRSIANDAGWPAGGTGLHMSYDLTDDRAYVFGYDYTGGAAKELRLGGTGDAITILADGKTGVNDLAPDNQFDVGGDINAHTGSGYMINDTAVDTHVLIGDGTRGVFRALVAADLPAIGSHWTDTGVFLHPTNVRNVESAAAAALWTLNTATGSGAFAQDADVTSYMGRAALGWDGATADIATFAHVDMNGLVSAALRQSAVGNTYLNAADTKQVAHRINNVDRMLMSATATKFYSGQDLEMYDGAPGNLVGSWDGATGNLSLRSNAELRFYDNGNYVGFEAPALAADKIWVLPAVDGAGNTVLTTNGGGTLSWTVPTPAAHNLLSAQHGDTVASSMTRGDIIIGTAGGWDDLGIGAANAHLESDGNDVGWVVNIGMAALATVDGEDISVRWAAYDLHTHLYWQTNDPTQAESTHVHKLQYNCAESSDDIARDSTHYHTYDHVVDYVDTQDALTSAGNAHSHGVAYTATASGAP